MTELTHPPIKLIALDVDGTLLNSKHELSDRNRRALIAAREAGVQVVLATGKTRHSTARVIEAAGLKTPGIYVQGLVTYDGDGKLMSQQTLDPGIVRQAITYAEDRGFAVMLYSGTRILVRAESKIMDDAITPYHEPKPEAVGPLQNVLGSTSVNKVVVMGEPRAIKALRWQLNLQIGTQCRVIQAGVPNMLEVLPLNTSKGTALRKLLKELQIPNENVLAMGDAENDMEMFQLVGLPVAIGNAEEKLKTAAKHVVASNDDDGVAEAIERFVLGRKLDEPKAAPAEAAKPADVKTDAPKAEKKAEPKAEKAKSEDKPVSDQPNRDDTSNDHVKNDPPAEGARTVEKPKGDTPTGGDAGPVGGVKDDAPAEGERDDKPKS